MDLTTLQFQQGLVNTVLPTESQYTLIAQLEPGWTIVISSTTGFRKLTRTFKFDSYSQGLDFACKVGKLADHWNHHPQIVIDFSEVTVNWWTHTANGLASNDFFMARLTESATVKT